MKKIYIIICLLLSTNYVYSDFLICDSWNINISKNNTYEICEWWYKNTDLIKINSFTGDFIHLNSWNFWNIVNEKTYDLNFIIPSYFLNNIKTIITNNNPYYNNEIWYYGQFNVDKDLMSKYDLVKWFFSINLKTKITNDLPIFSNDLWFFWDIVILKNVNWLIDSNEAWLLVNSNSWSIFINSNSWTLSTMIKTNTIMTYKKFYFELFKKYSTINTNEYNNFLNKLVDYLLKDLYYIDNPIISDIEIKRIEFYIEKSDFRQKMEKLSNNFYVIDNEFKKTDDDYKKYFLLDYLLNN